MQRSLARMIGLLDASRIHPLGKLSCSLHPLFHYVQAVYMLMTHLCSLGFAEAVEEIPTWAYRSFSDGSGTWDPSVSSVTAAANTGSWTTTLSRSFAEASNTT